MRGLSRSLAAICRHVAVQIVSQEDERLGGRLLPQDRHLDAAPAEQPVPETASVHKHDLKTWENASGPLQWSAGQMHARQAAEAGSAHVPPAQMGATDAAELEQHAADLGWDTSGTASAGRLFWGNLWGGLKTALVPPRMPMPDNQALAAGLGTGLGSQQMRGSHVHPRLQELAASAQQLQEQLPLSNPYGVVLPSRLACCALLCWNTFCWKLSCAALLCYAETYHGMCCMHVIVAC